MEMRNVLVAIVPANNFGRCVAHDLASAVAVLVGLGSEMGGRLSADYAPLGRVCLWHRYLSFSREATQASLGTKSVAKASPRRPGRAGAF
jgi:hypothetical protein